MDQEPRENPVLPGGREKPWVIRSYVLRAGRISPGQKRAYDEYSGRFCLPFSASILDFGKAFGNGNPVVVEIGFGMGRATVQIAAKNPGINYLGIEVHTPGVGKLLLRMKENGVTNIRIIERDAVEVFRSMLHPCSVEGIHIFFPDPWHKKRHHKRRLIRDDSVGLFLEALKPGGYVHVATDWEDYAVQILGVLNRRNELTNTAEGFAPRPSWRPETAFEKKGSDKGRRIFEIIFKKERVSS